MLIQARNTLADLAQYTYLTNLEQAGTTTLRARNTAGLTTQWAIQIGKTGEEQTEVVIGTAASGSTITCGATGFEHPADTPIFFIKYDQIVFERSTAGTAGTASPLTSGTITMQPDSAYTQFDDTTGAATHAYRTYFRNSAGLGTSTESDWITPSGFSFWAQAKMRQRVRDKLYTDSFVADDQINDWLNEYMEVMTNAAISVNSDYLLGTTSVGFGTAGLGTITASDFKDVRRFWVTYDGVNTFQAVKALMTEFTPNQIFNTTHPYFQMFGDSVFAVSPAQSGTASIVYYALAPVLSSDAAEVPVSMKGYTKGFVDYALGMALQKDDKGQEGQAKITTAMQMVERFKQEITPRLKTGSTYIKVVEAMAGDDDVLL